MQLTFTRQSTSTAPRRPFTASEHAGPGPMKRSIREFHGRDVSSAFNMKTATTDSTHLPCHRQQTERRTTAQKAPTAQPARISTTRPAKSLSLTVSSGIWADQNHIFPSLPTFSSGLRRDKSRKRHKKIAVLRFCFDRPFGTKCQGKDHGGSKAPISCNRPYS